MEFQKKQFIAYLASAIIPFLIPLSYLAIKFSELQDQFVTSIDLFFFRDSIIFSKYFLITFEIFVLIIFSMTLFFALTPFKEITEKATLSKLSKLRFVSSLMIFLGVVQWTLINNGLNNPKVLIYWIPLFYIGLFLSDLRNYQSVKNSLLS